MTDPFGFLNIDKPLRLTSHDVVARVRRAFRLNKVGHAGTLDPLATGVLIVCVGHATRLSEYVMASTKRYTAKIRLGVTTTTYDLEGEIVAQRDASHLQPADITAVLPRFIGEIDQIPPMYSAIKQGGKKLYDLARAGQTVEREARRITIEGLTVRDTALPDFDLDVVCSAGTYIRSLAYDIGEALGVGAHLTGLVRTGSGAFTLEDAVSLDTLLGEAAESAWTRHLLPAEMALSGWMKIVLSASQVTDILHGRAVDAAPKAPPETLTQAVTPDGETVALLRAGADGMWHPVKVFA